MNNIPLYISQPGLICGAGLQISSLWHSLITGSQKGICDTTAVDGTHFYVCKIEDQALKTTKARFPMRIIQIENMALSQLGSNVALIREKYGADRIAVCVGSCDNGSERSIAAHRIYFEKGVFPDSYSLEEQGADYVATFIAEKFKLTGPAMTFSTACSSSATAIARAADMIQSGIVDAAIVGGVDVISDTVLLGFNSLEAVSHTITNPFSKNRTGITLGEGAAFFILSKERLDSDIQLLGYGESADAHHITSPDPDGTGAIACMTQALRSAGLKPEDIDYINLHGTGTHLNDSMESKAVDSVFGSYKVPVSTTKPITGHTLGAAGALEVAVCFASIAYNEESTSLDIRLPVQVWDFDQDEKLPDLNFVTENIRTPSGKVRYCLSNTFAFGGCNVTLVIGRTNDSD